MSFAGISQPWLRDLAKRWARWRLASGIGAGSVAKGALAVTRFSAFLASPEVSISRLDQVDRELLERYLAELHDELAGRNVHAEPATAMFHYEDYPKRGQLLPRALAEHVMAQLEDPANLDRWDDPARRLVTLILIRCGLRLGDALRLPLDCIVHDADQAPYLRYQNHKMKRRRSFPSTRSSRPRSPDSGTASAAAGPKGHLCCSPADAPTLTAASGPAIPATSMRSASGCCAATSATSTASRCI